MENSITFVSHDRMVSPPYTAYFSIVTEHTAVDLSKRLRLIFVVWSLHLKAHIILLTCNRFGLSLYLDCTPCVCLSYSKIGSSLMNRMDALG